MEPAGPHDARDDSGRRLDPDDPLACDDFWTGRSRQQLAEAQGAEVVDCIEMLQDDTVSDGEAEAFVAALGL